MGDVLLIAENYHLTEILSKTHSVFSPIQFIDVLDNNQTLFFFDRLLKVKLTNNVHILKTSAYRKSSCGEYVNFKLYSQISCKIAVINKLCNEHRNFAITK